MIKTEAVRAFSKLIRLELSLFGAFGVIVSGLLAGDLQGFQMEYQVAFLIVFFSAVGSFSFNDYYDLEVDRRNFRHDRPLVTGSLSRKVASITALLSFLSVLLLSLLLNLLAISLVLVSLPLFIFYSLGLKRMIFVKNVLIAYAYAATILFGSLVSDATVEPLIMYFAAMSLIVGIAVKVMLDISDVKGDKDLGIDTIATRFGLKTAAQVSVILYGVIMILDPLPFFVMIDPRIYLDYLFLVLILIPIAFYILISKSLMRDQSKKSIFQLKKLIFVTMQIGSVVYLIGVLI